jgi:hypothetical protein
MAGFSKNQAYFVPRALLQLPHPIGWYEERLLPELTTWRQQAAYPTQGDKSLFAKKFLHELTPYFLDVAVQDGIHFVRDFPNHPFTHLLKGCTLRNCTTVLCPFYLSHYQIYIVLQSLGYSS